MKREKRIVRDDSGSVMMEYIILNLGLILTVVAAGLFFFPDTGDYGLLGNAFIQHYNLVLDIVSMPYP